MRALHRTVVVGAFGGLAVATAAGSMAFACSPIDGVQLVDAAGTRLIDPRVNPGETVTMKVYNFTNEGGTRKNDVTGESMTTGPVEIIWFSSRDGVGTVIGTEAQGTTIRQLTIPADLSSARPGWIVVQQRAVADGSLLAIDAERIFSKSGPPPATNLDAQPPAPNQPVKELPTATPAVRPSTPTARTPGAQAQQAPVAGSVAAPAPAAAPARTTAAVPAPAPTAAAEPAVVTGIAAPVVPLAPAIAEPAGQQAPSDLWTGLSSERLPSLLDSPQAPASSGVPMGAVLFGTGVLTLVGAALALGGRRLAVVRRITSRR